MHAQNNNTKPNKSILNNTLSQKEITTTVHNKPNNGETINTTMNEKNKIQEIKDKHKEKALKEMENNSKIKEEKEDDNFSFDEKSLGKKTKREEISIIKMEDEIELKRIEINKNLYVRLLESNGELVVDFCKFYKGFPTKKNIRINLNKFKKLNDILN